MEKTIPHLVQGAAQRFGQSTAIEDGDVHLNFQELAHAGLETARAFLQAGLKAGDRVGVWAPNIHEWIVAAIGIQSAGGVLVPLNTRMKGTEAAYILRKSGARWLCTMGDFLGAIERGSGVAPAATGDGLPALLLVRAPPKLLVPNGGWRLAVWPLDNDLEPE